jgi:hypothetical protein
MKHLQTLTLFILSVILFTTCQKSNDLTVTLKQSGILKIQLTDKNNNPLVGNKVKLYTNFAYSLSGNQQSYDLLYDTKTTDANGSVDFGELNQGIYVVVSEKVKVGNISYNVMKPVQLVTGNSNSLAINPEDYVGKITLKVYMSDNYSSGSYSPVSNANVVLVNYDDFVDSMTHQEILAKAAVTGQTDTHGKVVFEKAPANFDYKAYVYYTDTTAAWANNNSDYIYVSKDGETEVSILVSSKDLLHLKSTLNLTVQFYGYDKNNNYGYHAVPDANVILVDYTSYYDYNLSYASISTINSHKITSGKTDSSGNVVLKNIPQGTDCMAFVYYSDTYRTWGSSSFYVNYLIENRSVEVDEYNLGLN